MKRLPIANQLVQTSGITLFVALVASRVILALSPTDSLQREFGRSAVDAVCWLYLFWAGIAVIAVLRNRDVAKYFWLVFTTNVIICFLILAQLWTY